MNMKRIVLLALAALAIFAVAEVRAGEASVVSSQMPQMQMGPGDKMPKFLGEGDGNLNDFCKWVGKELTKRTAAANKAGRVMVVFKVMADGTVVVDDKPAMNTQADPELFAEVRRVIEDSAGMWEPAVQNGNKVNVQFVMPVTFEKAKATKPEKKAKPTKKERKAKR